MKNSELDHILKSAPVPERPGEFWEEFPRRVTIRIHERASEEKPILPSLAGLVRIGILAPTVKTVGYFLSPWRAGTVFGRTAVALGLASVLVFGALLIRFEARQDLGAVDPQFAELQKCYREIEPLFPNQLKAIVWDNGGAELILADAATVPSSTPLYLRICGPNGCRRFVTFSGQQIRVNGDVCDVLLDRQGNIIIAGRQLVWSSAKATGTAGPYQIEARPLGTTG